MPETRTTPTRRWYITFSGAAMNIPGHTAEQAINYIRGHAECYAGFQAREIGVEVDALGWPIDKGGSDERQPG